MLRGIYHRNTSCLDRRASIHLNVAIRQYALGHAPVLERTVPG
ncbi:Uncharacterised protein [Pseudomonas fluorescens]|uniref:Uncharacterized protein n=1 Tax=Pseudomonas fluorescens TaxID=294 RepID=A0A379IE56_PSEFL|nr:Uncharacterised protein [Pseudomonas fluorescens]